MNNCTVCDGCFRNENPNKIICDGICRQSFHAECVNFSKNALSCYRELPNLQWFCDGCIIQTRSSNVSSPPFDKLNSTVVIPTSSLSFNQRSLNATKRNRNPFLNAKPNKSSVFLANRSPTVEQNIRNANGSLNSSVNEMQPEHEYHANKSNPTTTSVITQHEVDQPKPKHDSDEFKETVKETLHLENALASPSSFAEVLTKSSTSIAETVTNAVENSARQKKNDLLKLQRNESPQTETLKVVYVTNFHPSVTENEVVDYLLSKKIITSPEHLSCKKLVSPFVSMDSVSFVSFKITVDSKIFDSLVKSELWPDGVIAREFVKR